MQVWKSYEVGNIVWMIDPTIIDTCDKEEVLRCIHVSLLCAQAESSHRPPMSKVTLMLSTDSVTDLADARRPAFLSYQVSQNMKFTSTNTSSTKA